MSARRSLQLLAAILLLLPMQLRAAEPPATAPGVDPTADLPTARLDSKFSVLSKVNAILAERDKDPFGAIVKDMGTATELLTKFNTSEPVQPQQKQIVAGLDYMIEMLEKQKKNMKAGGGPNPNMPLPDSVIAKGPGGSGPLHDPNASSKAWGNLPPKQREQILQSQNEGFPAGFEAILSSYYKRLAQENVAEGADGGAGRADHSSLIQHMTLLTPNRTRAVLFVLALSLTLTVKVRAGGALTADDASVDGEVIAFDGKDITIEMGIVNGQPARRTIALKDLIHVRLAYGPATTASPRAAVVGAAPAGSPVMAIPAPARSGITPAQPPAAQPVVLPNSWQMQLTGSDAVQGTLKTWINDKLAFELQQGGVELSIPSANVIEIWRRSTDLIRRSKALAVESASDDVAYVLQNTDVVAVKGVCKRIEDDVLVFRYDEQDRKIAMGRLVGLVLVRQKSAASAAPITTFHQALRLFNGDAITGRWTSLDNGAVNFVTVWDQSIKLPVASVTGIDVRNGRVVYLSDTKPVRVEQTPYFDRVMNYRTDVSLAGAPIKLSDGAYSHGIAVHSRCVLEYNIGGTFDRFRTKMGFEQPGGALGRAAVKVVADGKTIYENADARGDQKPEDLNFDVKGVKSLILEVDFGRDEDVADRVIWANARLLRADVGQ